MKHPRISVLVNTYNHERYIEQAIDSILEQDFPSFETEIVVVDDGSTDRTSEILRQYEPRVRVIRKSNGGQASAFNVGIPATNGEIVAFLDGDDWWHKSKLSAVVEAFDGNPDVAAVGHGYFEVPDQSAPTSVFIPYKMCKVDATTKETAAFSCLAGNLLATSRLAIRRAILDIIGPVHESLIFCADGPLLSLSVALGGAILLDRPLCYYRVHSGSLFTHSARDKAKILRKADMLSLIAVNVRERLKLMGVADEIASAMTDQYQILADRFRSSCGAVSHRDNAIFELRDFRAKVAKASLLYLLFKSFVTALAYVVPSERFTRIRDWYCRMNLGRWRSKIAPAESLSPTDLIRIIPAQSEEARQFFSEPLR